MKMALTLISAALVGGSMVFATPASGQSADGWWEWAAPLVLGGEEVRTTRGPIAVPLPRDGDVRRGEERGGIDPRSRDRRTGPQAGRGAQRQGQGPPFCRNGQGHPVHGTRWCSEKGWSRVGWEDVIFRTPRDRRQGVLDRGGLIDVLGDVVFGRIDGARRGTGSNGPLVGRWVREQGTGATILQIRAGSTPIAELTDITGDGRADIVLLPGS